jgi:hypothetical protein
MTTHGNIETRSSAQSQFERLLDPRLPEDHRPFWNQKLKQKARALARQEHKVAALPVDQVGQYKRYMWRLRKELTACYADLIEHSRTMDAKSATRILRVTAWPVVFTIGHLYPPWPRFSTGAFCLETSRFQPLNPESMAERENTCGGLCRESLDLRQQFWAIN